MRRILVHTAVVLLVMSSFVAVGCDTRDSGGGDVGAAGPTDISGRRRPAGTPSDPTGSNSNNNPTGGTIIGTGSPGGDAGRIVQPVGVPGNIESGKGIATRPSSDTPESAVYHNPTGTPASSGQTGGGGQSTYSGNTGGAPSSGNASQGSAH
ncbi:MAG TPA: hypothetical protein VLJ39_09825 [Tepidisphaeraceae bacterium]|nr:hypothetical protein [Tepidisphaeraceae bacterium]